MTVRSLTHRARNRRSRAAIGRSSGTTLLEVLVAIVIFMVGMLALVHLQGNLGRSGADSNARTVASNIAEEIVESLRTFEQIPTDPNGIKTAYEDITDGTQTMNRGGVDFTVATDVQDWFYGSDGVTVTQTAPAGRTVSDFKVVEMTVSWAGSDFHVDDDSTTGNRLGSGALNVVNIIPSIPALSNAKVASIALNFGGPQVDYTPGLNPEIIAIQIDDSKFKESTRPEPIVFRRDELVETWFDVVTYSQNEEAGAIYLRREEFLAVTCDCTLRTPTAGTDGGFRPTIWTGPEYSAAEFVAKPYGESANNNQSFYCDVCCRDHHDSGGAGAAGEELYDPFRASGEYHTTGALTGDHMHYGADNQGVLTLAEPGEDYLEACRMVRKDGFMRVAQDLRQEALFAFPEDYLDSDDEVAEYSEYLTGAAIAYESGLADCEAENTCSNYESSPPAWLAPVNASPSVVFPASDPASPTVLPTSYGSTQQQLRSRGVYQDFYGDELRWAINCMQIDGNTGEDCGVPGTDSALEITPFFEVQLTFLSRWNENPANTPVDVTNETVASNNTHSRGLAEKQPNKSGNSIVTTTAHEGNLGLTATSPIDPQYNADLSNYNLYVLAEDENQDPPPSEGTTISGSLSSAVSGFKASSVTVTGSGGALCGQTDAIFTCSVTGTAPFLTLSGMTKGASSYYACSSNSSLVVTSPGPGTTVFALPVGQTIEGVSIVIRSSPCS